jgi:F-type H+-transporting ATPase subunit epsilon
MSTMRIGDLLIHRSSGDAPERIAIEGGFAEVNERGLTVLAERADVAA